MGRVYKSTAVTTVLFTIALLLHGVSVWSAVFFRPSVLIDIASLAKFDSILGSISVREICSASTTIQKIIKEKGERNAEYSTESVELKPSMSRTMVCIISGQNLQTGKTCCPIVHYDPKKNGAQPTASYLMKSIIF